MKLYVYEIIDYCDGELFFNESEINVDEKIDSNKFITVSEFMPIHYYETERVFVNLSDGEYIHETHAHIYLEEKTDNIEGIKELLRRGLIDELEEARRIANNNYLSLIEDYKNMVIV